MDFDSFKAEWLGKRVADTTLGAVGLPPAQYYQCVSLAKQYLRECFGIEPGYWGDAIQYWSATNPALYAKFDRLETPEVQKGDIVILRTKGRSDYGGEGHIMIGTGGLNASEFEGLEQNGSTGSGTGIGDDAIRTRWVDKNRVAGALRPHHAPLHPYHIEARDPFKMVIKAGAKKWDLDKPTFELIRDNPILTMNQDKETVFNGELHHNALPQYTYYVEDANLPFGYNVLDLKDWTPPPPPAPAPPAAPYPVPKAPEYEVYVPLPYYANSTKAQNLGTNAGILQPGTYKVFAEEFGCKNLTDDNQKDRNQWINPRENKLPEPVKVEVKPLPLPLPAPTPVPLPKPQPFTPKLPDVDKATFSAFTPDRQAVTFVMEDNYNFRDLNGYSNKIVLRKLYDEVEMVGTFYHEGREWTRVFVEDNNGKLDINRWFACPTINSATHTPYVTPHDKIYSTQKTIHEQIELKPNAPYTKAIQFGVSVDALYDKAIKTIDGFFRRKHQK